MRDITIYDNPAQFKCNFHTLLKQKKTPKKLK